MINPFEGRRDLFGKPLDRSELERLLAGEKEQKSGQLNMDGGKLAAPFMMPAANINPSDYIQIPKHNLLIGRREILKGTTWKKAHGQLQKEGLIMPPLPAFMVYFIDVHRAARGDSQLYDGNNSPLSQADAKEIWDYLASTRRSSMGDCWTWLDAQFKQKAGVMHMYTNHRVQVDPGTNKKVLRGTQLSLGSRVTESGYVSLNLNSEGLPIARNNSSNYSQGQNLYYYPPTNGGVAWFDADSGGAGLDCGGDPQFSFPELGVFPCAEGVSAKKIDSKQSLCS